MKKLLNFLNEIRISKYVSLYTKWETYDDLREKANLANETQYLKRTKLHKLIRSLFDTLFGLPLLIFVLIVEIVIVMLIYLKAILNTKTAPILKEQLIRYVETYGHSGICGMKFLEGRYFRELKILRPSMEIGISQGETSHLFFGGKRFDIGSEYIYEDIIKNPYSLWGTKVVCDLRALPFKTGSIKSLFSVHVIDSIKEEQLEEVVNEVSRVLKITGQFAFSGFGEAYYQLPYYTRFLKSLGLNNFAGKLEKHRYDNFHCFNLYSREKWKRILNSSGLEVERHITFGGRPISILFYNIHHFLHKYTRVLKAKFFYRIPLSKRIWSSILSTCFLWQVQTDKKNDEKNDLFFFAVYKKNG